MRQLENPWRGKGLALDVPMPASDAGPVLSLLQDCPAHAKTPLVPFQGVGGVAQIWIKDERTRMGLGSFKALGATHVIAHAAQSGPLENTTYVTASAGNHGLSVAAGARVFGARAVVFLSETVPAVFADRLRAKGAEVVRAGHDYEASMQAAARAAAEHGWILLSDSSWDGYTELPHRLMEGYLAMAEEAANQVPEPPTHILLQAGVGGLAGAVAAHARARWGDGPMIIIVEPDAAPALYESVKAGEAVETTGPVSIMGRLDCKAPSLIALQGLSRDADAFVLVSDAEAEAVLPALAKAGLATTASGGAGVAALMAGAVADPNARVLAFLTEAPE